MDSSGMLKFELKKLRNLNYTYKLLILFLFLCMGLGGFAQLPDYHLQMFDHSFGLRPGSINGLTKDKQGFLWILYPRSVQRFDGKGIKTFKLNGALETIFSDSEGRVWVTSIDHVYLFDQAVQQFEEIPLITSDTLVQRGYVFEMPGQKVWVNTTTAFYEYDAQHRQFVRILKDLPIPQRYSRGGFAAYKNTLFINHGQWIYRYHTITRQLDSLPHMTFRRAYPISEDSLLVNSWRLVSYWHDFKNDTITPAILPPALKDAYSPHLNLRSVVEVAPFQFVMSSREGLFKFDQRTNKYEPIYLFYHGSPVITKELASTLYFDTEGYIWMATVDGVGRFPLHEQSFGLKRLQNKTGDIPAGIDNIRSITADDRGNLWFATGNGFAKWNRVENVTRIYLPKDSSKTQLSFPSVRGIWFDGKNILLGPSNYGFWIFNPVTNQYFRPTYKDEATRLAIEDDFIDAILGLKNGDHIVTCRDHIYVLNGKTYELSLLDIPAARENSNYAFQGHQGEVWVTTTKALHLLDSNLQYIRNVPLPMKNKYIYAGNVLSDGRFLFSVEDGLFTASLHNDSVTIERYSDLFDKIYVTTVVEDKRGRIWATSENGIYRYDPSANKVDLFDYSDNVQGYGFNPNSWLLGKDGYLYLGGTNGINYFKPENIKPQDIQLNLFIETVRGGPMDSTFYPIDQLAVLPWKQRSFEVEFICPYYNNPDKVKYRYVLTGNDQEWKYIGSSNTLRFTSLPAGQFTLQLEASINNVDWSPARNSFTFRIKPPVWLQWWFMSLVALVLASALSLFVRSRNKRVEEQQEELEAEQAINYFSTRISVDQSVDDLVWDVARNCIGRLQFEDCVIYLVDEDRNVLVQKAAHGPKSPSRHQIVQPIEIKLGEGITGMVAETGVAELIHDTSRDPRYIVDDERRYSEITVPIIADGKVLGVIDCEHSRKRFFTQRHLSILTTIASLCAAKITRVRAETEKTETERILMATKQQMADIEMQALRAQMNPHFIFNCLNSINRYIVKSDQATASLYLTRFAKLIRLILDNSNSKTVTLTNELEALRLYIEMESIRFEKQFEYAITIDDEVHPDHIFVPPLIIQPYVENAIWHGLLHKETAGHLHVHITRKASSLLECIIDDDGIGREKAKELKSKSASNSKSLGMKLTESRLALLNKHSNWDASVEIIDLKTDSGDSAGTRVVLRIPVDV